MMNLARVTANFARMGERKMLKVVKESYIAIANTQEFNVAIDTSAFKDSFVGGIGSVNKSIFEPGHSALNELALLLNGFRLGQTFYYTNSQPYAFGLEFEGTSQQQPNGTVRLAARRWPRIVAEQIRANQ